MSKVTTVSTTTTVTTTEENNERKDKTYVIKLKRSKLDKKVQWTEDVVDNEFMKKKKSKSN